MTAHILALLTLIVITLLAVFGGIRSEPARPAYTHVETKPSQPPPRQRRVMFNKYNTERRYGKNTGNVLSTAVVKAPAAA